MTVTVASFQADYPEFASNPTLFPTTIIQNWINRAGELLNATRWSDQLDYGTELFVAHNVALQGKRIATANAGGVPGTVEGPVASKSVDKASISYSAAGLDLKAGHWQLTVYGMQFIQLARAMGSGGIQTGPGNAVGYGPGPFSGIWG